MTRADHNAKHGANRQPVERVNFDPSGVGELAQYDPDCPACYLSHAHTWADHDRYLTHSREAHK